MLGIHTMERALVKIFALNLSVIRYPPTSCYRHDLQNDIFMIYKTTHGDDMIPSDCYPLFLESDEIDLGLTPESDEIDLGLTPESDEIDLGLTPESCAGRSSAAYFAFIVVVSIGVLML